MRMNEADKAGLEAVIDAFGLENVLETIAEICGEKAMHIAQNWQDTRLAKDWERMGQFVEAAETLVRQYHAGTDVKVTLEYNR